jgi:hypothetical protein
LLADNLPHEKVKIKIVEPLFGDNSAVDVDLWLDDVFQKDIGHRLEEEQV